MVNIQPRICFSTSVRSLGNPQLWMQIAPLPPHLHTGACVSTRHGMLCLKRVMVGLYIIQQAWLTYQNDSMHDYLSNIDPNFVHCQGHRPSQFIPRSSVCDGKINCNDRSDESDCDATSETGVRLYWVGKFLFCTPTWNPHAVKLFHQFRQEQPPLKTE